MELLSVPMVETSSSCLLWVRGLHARAERVLSQPSRMTQMTNVNINNGTQICYTDD